MKLESFISLNNDKNLKSLKYFNLIKIDTLN